LSLTDLIIRYCNNREKDDSFLVQAECLGL
jgi:hypothetical protein